MKVEERANQLLPHLLNRMPGPQGYTANATSNLMLTTSAQDVPGATITLAAAGTYLILATFKFDATAGSSVSSCIGLLTVDGVDQTGIAELGYFTNTERVRASVHQHWIVTTAANKVAKLRARKATDYGSMFVQGTDTRITAIKLA